MVKLVEEEDLETLELGKQVEVHSGLAQLQLLVFGSTSEEERRPARLKVDSVAQSEE